jgi:Na+-translocating ferredoxin:NAD+ oxidoreductase RnfG subunit
LPSSRRACVALALALAGWAAPASGKVYLSRQEALAWAFPEAERVEERSLVLSEEQARAVEALARERLESRIVKLYTAHGAAGVQGYAFIDVHTVRTLPEAFLVVLTPQGEVRSLRVLAFYEPEEYRPPARWLEQFEGRGLEAGTALGGAIHGIAGSTLSARAVTGSVRRALALYQVLVGGAGK